MRVLTVVFDRGHDEGAWMLMEGGTRVSGHRHAERDDAVEEAKRMAAFAHARGDPRDVRIATPQGPVLVPAPEFAAAYLEQTAARSRLARHR